MAESIKLTKKVFINGIIELLTGLLIGGTDTGIDIGGVDKTVVRNPLNNQPYIPGSSLKGKMRSLLEKKMGLKLEKVSKDVSIHKCTGDNVCILCRVFGIPAEVKAKHGDTRLIVRDAEIVGYRENGEYRIGNQAVELLSRNRNMVLPYTEVKTEVVIDRVTSRATPRTFERVPAGVLFNLKLVCNVFEGDSEDRVMRLVFDGLRLLQDDYLGGQGSRGYGQVNIKINNITETTFDAQTGEVINQESNISIPEELL